jgi:ParB family chromosome partitioning protein
MTTIAKTKNKSGNNRTALKKIESIKPAFAPVLTEWEPKNIPLAEIELSPLNYRKYISQKKLEDFAAEIAVHGIISPVTVRRMPNGSYQLVVGERRILAARLNNFTSVPAMVRELTDQQVTEIQLAENLQRVDPHPLDESHGIAIMQSAGMTIDEIAARLGKSKAFVYTRIKISTLTEDLKEMFIEDKINLLEAAEIAGLSAQSQAEFYEQHCKDWKKKNFSLNNLRYLISRYRYDLKNAPFDTSDTQLLAGAGACHKCPLNSATLKSLFPEMAKEAVCSGKSCYQQKCLAQSERSILKALQDFQPEALILSSGVAEETISIISNLPQTAGLPQYGFYDVRTITQPTPPSKEDFTEEWEEEEGEEGSAFDAEGFDNEMEEYEEAMLRYRERLESGQVVKGLYISSNEVKIVHFDPSPRAGDNTTKGVSAKDVQEAIKAGTATVELLQGGIERINAREKRAKELDAEKVQQTLHEQFCNTFFQLEGNNGLTPADHVALRLLVYQSLNYHSKSYLDEILNAKINGSSFPYDQQQLDALAELTDQQFSVLIRIAVAAKPESKLPSHVNAVCLNQVALGAGLDIAAIEQQQQAKAKERQDKSGLKIIDLQNRINNMKPQEQQRA